MFWSEYIRGFKGALHILATAIEPHFLGGLTVVLVLIIALYAIIHYAIEYSIREKDQWPDI